MNLTLGDVVSEKVDHLGQSWDVCRQEYHFCLGKAFQEGLTPGATDGSSPVGSVEIIYAILKN